MKCAITISRQEREGSHAALATGWQICSSTNAHFVTTLSAEAARTTGGELRSGDAAGVSGKRRGLETGNYNKKTREEV